MIDFIDFIKDYLIIILSLIVTIIAIFLTSEYDKKLKNKYLPLFFYPTALFKNSCYIFSAHNNDKKHKNIR